jgi:hypothetical protein
MPLVPETCGLLLLASGRYRDDLPGTDEGPLDET